MNASLQERVDAVIERMAQACARCGRDPSSVQLIAVSKTYEAETIRAAAECGLRVFGESKVQEAKVKIPLCPGNLTWHMIGHLQRNKVGMAVELFDRIHSVDSQRLLEAVDHASSESGKTMPVLLEVNVSGEASKFGLPPEDVPVVLTAANGLNHVTVVGLMTMPPFTDEPEKARAHFRKLRELRDQWRDELGFGLEELSMGMSHDFEVAIEEGATWVRVGTAIFGEREAKT